MQDVFNAISLDDHKALVKIVREVCEGIPNEKVTSDAFVHSRKINSDGTVLPLRARIET